MRKCRTTRRWSDANTDLRHEEAKSDAADGRLEATACWLSELAEGLHRGPCGHARAPEFLRGRTPVRIEVFADVACPFTHVGLCRLVARRRESNSDAVLWVRAWPLELVNGEPL